MKIYIVAEYVESEGAPTRSLSVYYSQRDAKREAVRRWKEDGVYVHNTVGMPKPAWLKGEAEGEIYLRSRARSYLVFKVVEREIRE